MLDNVHWLGHASVRISGSKVVCIDPWKIKESATKADVVLITHDHYDHCSPQDIRKVLKEGTELVAPPDCISKLPGKAKAIRPGSTVKAAGIDVSAVRAYNIGKQYHPMDRNWVGYVFSVDGVTFYHSGDTDVIPEMKNIKTDVAFLAIGGDYTMNVDEAIEAARMINPKVVVPIHWGEIVGSMKDAKRFEKGCPSEVRILAKE